MSSWSDWTLPELDLAPREPFPEQLHEQVELGHTQKYLKGYDRIAGRPHFLGDNAIIRIIQHHLYDTYPFRGSQHDKEQCARGYPGCLN